MSKNKQWWWIVQKRVFKHFCRIFFSMIGLSVLNANGDFYQGEKLNIDGDIQLKLVTLDELPVDGGFKLPETTYSDVVTSLWATWQAAENVRIKAWVKNEFRNYVKNKAANNYRFLDEFAFHELSAEFTNLLGGGLDLKVGRFPLLGYGRGLQILESSPLDAERSYGFNAVRGRLKFERIELDLIGMYSPREDEFLINNKKKTNGFLESAEQGFVAYLHNKFHPNLPKSLYYMYKHEQPRFGREDLYLHTAGFIWEHELTPAWSTYWETAHQLGHRARGGDVRGWLSDFFLTYRLADRPWKPELYVNNYYLSGDDPNTETEENWHGLWARWPQDSYFMVWQFIPRIGDWTNMNWSRLGFKVYPGSRTSIEMSAGPITAPEKGLGGGNERGHLGIMILRHKLTEKLSMMARAEVFESGDFHPEEDNISWTARVQFKYEF